MNVLFLPDYPDKEFYTIVAIFMRLGWFATQNPESDFDFACAWQDQTWMDESEALSRISATQPVLNLHCTDISKRRVEREFHHVFCRSSFVDPAHYQGRAVEKFDENARGGRVVNLPLAIPDEHCVYQRLIDSSQDGSMVEYRVPVILDEIPLVYRERKDIPADRIKTAKKSIEICPWEAVFSAAENADIRNFCRRMGLDFGELDILRAKDDGQIYILDANKTPGGFGMFNKVKWRHEQRQQAIECLATTLERRMDQRLKAIGRR